MVAEVGEQDVVRPLFPHLYDNDRCIRLIASCFQRFLVPTLFSIRNRYLAVSQDQLTNECFHDPQVASRQRRFIVSQRRIFSIISPRYVYLTTSVIFNVHWTRLAERIIISSATCVHEDVISSLAWVLDSLTVC